MVFKPLSVCLINRFQSVLDHVGFVLFEIDAIITCDQIIENVTHIVSKKELRTPIFTLPLFNFNSLVRASHFIFSHNFEIHRPF